MRVSWKVNKNNTKVGLYLSEPSIKVDIGSCRSRFFCIHHSGGEIRNVDEPKVKQK